MLLKFALHRHKGENYRIMREYFAGILIEEIERRKSMQGALVLDVGGADGSFCKVLSEQRDCTAINVEPYPESNVWKRTAVSYANAMPFSDSLFDFVICRGVLEHIVPSLQEPSIREMHRVLKGDGFSYFVIPPWYNFHAGHQLKPFHILPFGLARFMRQLVYRSKVPGNSFADLNLYSITHGRMVSMLRRSGFSVVDTYDTHFRAHIATKIPVIREIAVPAVAFLVRKTTAD